ncbi:MAG: hypothetical protein ACPL7I_07390 [Myxococcota bacterium]
MGKTMTAMERLMIIFSYNSAPVCAISRDLDIVVMGSGDRAGMLRGMKFRRLEMRGNSVT